MYHGFQSSELLSLIYSNSGTLCGRKNGHLLTYDCPVPINLRDLTTPYFHSQWDYISMSPSFRVEDEGPLGGWCNPSLQTLVLPQGSQWTWDLNLVNPALSPTTLHVVSGDSQQGEMVWILHSCVTLWWDASMLFLPWSFPDLCVTFNPGHSPISLLCEIFDNIRINSLFA